MGKMGTFAAMQSLSSIWHKPRRVVRYLEAAPRFYFCILAVLSLCYFFQISAFMLSLPEFTFASLMTLNGLKLTGWSFLFVLVSLFTAIQAAALAVWVCAKRFGGQGTLPQTRNALAWSLLWTIPLIGFLLLIYFTIILPEQGVIAVVIRIISYIGTLAIVLYLPVIFVTTLSEAQRFGLWRAFISAVFGLILFAAFVFAVFQVFCPEAA
jgi:hypothetical protein